jgi:hypothetical protein
MAKRGAFKGLLAAFALALGVGVAPPVVAASQPGKDNVTMVASLPETKQIAEKDMKGTGGLRSWRPPDHIWLGRQKRGNRRGRSRWDYQR